MRYTSDAYKKSINQSFRNRSYVKITLGAFALGADEDAKFAPPSLEPQSDIGNLIKNYKYEQSYGSFEKDFFKVDGSQFLYPTKAPFYKRGLVTKALSNASGVFDEPQVLTIEFSKFFSMIGYTLTFDTVENDFPVDFDIECYRQGELIDTANVVGNQLSFLEYRSPCEDVDKLIFKFKKMNKPFRRLRLNSMKFGLGYTYGNEQITKVTQKGTVHPLSMELPKYELQFGLVNKDYEFDVDNLDGLVYFLEPDQQVNVQYGYTVDKEKNIVEWINGGNFTLKTWKTHKNRLEATFTCDTLVDGYNDNYYKGKFGETTLYDLAVDVFADMGWKKYRLDPYLKNMTTSLPLPQLPHKQCLQLIANMGRCILTRDDQDYIEMSSAFVPKYTVTSTPTTNYSNTQDILDLEHPSETYATFENQVFKVDGSQFLFTDAPPYQVNGLVSEPLSNDVGEFVGEKPKVTVDFESAYSTYGLSLDFGEFYPKEVTIKAYLEGVEKYSYTETVSKNIFALNRLLEDVNRIEIIWDKSQLPHQRARLSKLLGFGRETDFELTYNNIKGMPSGKTLPVLKYVNVKRYNYSTEAEPSELYKEKLTLDASGKTHLKIDFNEPVPDRFGYITNGTITNQEHYAYCSILDIEGTGETEIVIKGRKIEMVSHDTIIRHSDKGEVIEVDNPLIDKFQSANIVGEWVRDYATQRVEYDIDYRGNPELDVGDIIYIQTKHSGAVKAETLHHEISFNGALSGKLKTRGDV